MLKNSARLLILALAILGGLSASSAKAETCSGPDYSYRDSKGAQLVCFHCESATYCYYNQ